MHLYWFLIGLLRRIQKYTRVIANCSARIFQTPTHACVLTHRDPIFRASLCVNKTARTKVFLRSAHFFSRAKKKSGEKISRMDAL
jgi:hypothetical protein